MRSARKSSIIVLVLLAVGVAGTIMWWNARTSNQKTPVILISIDTLRADHAGVYGYHRETTPNLDALAAEAVVFERAYAPSPNTATSHATMLTGLRPVVHGCSPEERLMPKVKLLSEYFKENGYTTGGFATHGAWLTRKMGFAQGFDEFYSAFVNAPRVHKEALPFLEKHKKESIFMFLHYYDVHSDYHFLPYETGTEFDSTWCGDYSGGFTGCMYEICGSELLDKINRERLPMATEDIQYITDLYDGGVLFTDHYLGILLRRLKELGLYEKAIIVVTADHGEEFREHGNFLHTQYYDEVMHVPLIIKMPGQKAVRRVDGMTGLVDIVPTLLDAAGIEAAETQGVSLMPQVRGEAGLDPERVILSTLKADRLELAQDMALRTADYTFTTWEQGQHNRLYDIHADPGEHKDVQSLLPRVFQHMQREARRLYARDLTLRRRLGLKYGGTGTSAEQKEKLKSLGYL